MNSIAIAVLIGGIIIPLIAWRVVGARRRRDPLLVPILIIGICFLVAGVGIAITEGGRFDWKLPFGVVVLVAFAVRWRAASGPDSSSTPR